MNLFGNGTTLFIDNQNILWHEIHVRNTTIVCAFSAIIKNQANNSFLYRGSIIMKRYLLGLLCLFVLLCLQYPAAAADQRPEEPVRMEEVVVVASPIIEGNRVTNTGNQVTTVSKKAD